MSFSLIVAILFFAIAAIFSIWQRTKARSLKKKALKEQAEGNWRQAAEHLIDAIIERLDSKSALRDLVPRLQQIYSQNGLTFDPERVYKCPGLCKEIFKTKQKGSVHTQLLQQLHYEIRDYLTAPMSLKEDLSVKEGFFKTTFEAWRGGSLSMLSDKYADEHTAMGAKAFVKMCKAELGDVVNAARQERGFEPSEYLIAGIAPSFLMTNRFLYVFTENRLDGPVNPVDLSQVREYRTKGWLKGINIILTMESGEIMEFESLGSAPKDKYMNAFMGP